MSAESPRRPNVVLVFADQLQSQALSCYGGGQVHTPTFDRLAREGARFTNALSTWPLCTPYRGMLLTGLFPLRNGALSNECAVRPDAPSLARAFAAGGYRTGYIGKWHLEWARHNPIARDRRLGFDYWAVRNCDHRHYESFYYDQADNKVETGGYEAHEQARLAARFIEGHRDQPFCLVVSWGPPHDPYSAPAEYMSRFPADRLRWRGNRDERAIVDHLLATDPIPLSAELAENRARRRALIEDGELCRERCLRGYYAATEAIDDGMAVILDALDRQGLADDTIVVFTSDHGDMMGSHRMLSKQMPLEESLSIPFLIRYPRRIPPGTAPDALLTPIDVMPTLLGLAGLDCPAIDGRDFSEAATGGRTDQRDAALIMKLRNGGNPWLNNGVTSWRGVRTKRHTYARLLDRGPWLLFDNAADPLQLNNLIDSPAHADLRRVLEAATARLMAEAGDPGTDAGVEAAREEFRRRDTGYRPAGQ